MKKWLAVGTLIISLMILFSFGSAEDSQHVYLTVSCDSNWIFSRYDIDIYMDSTKVATLAHGQQATYIIEATSGQHKVWFYKFDNHDVNGQLKFGFIRDTDISCKIHCYGDRIDVQDETVNVRPTPEPTPVPPYKLALDQSELFLLKGETANIHATIVGSSDDLGADYQWLSSDPSIVSCVDGVVSGESSGSATITCIASLPGGIELLEDVSVQVFVSVDSIEVDENDVTLNIGRVYSPSFTVFPDDASEKGLSFLSSNSSVASINSEGVITAIGAGTTTITSTSMDGSNKSVSLTITVVDNRGSLGTSVDSLNGKSTGIVCSVLNEQLPILDVLFRRPMLPAFAADLTARQLMKVIDGFTFDATSNYKEVVAFVGLSIKSQEDLFMALQDQNGSFLLVSVNPGNYLISYGQDPVSYQDAEAFIIESSKTYIEVTSQEIKEVNDAVESIEESYDKGSKKNGRSVDKSDLFHAITTGFCCDEQHTADV